MNESCNMSPITTAEILESVLALAGQAQAPESGTLTPLSSTYSFELLLFKELLEDAPSVDLCIPAPLPHHQHPRCHLDLTRTWLIDLAACNLDLNLSLFFHPWQPIAEPMWRPPIEDNVPLPQMRICAFVLEVLLKKLREVTQRAQLLQEPEWKEETIYRLDLEELREIVASRLPCAECGQLPALEGELDPIFEAVHEALAYLNDAVRERENREEADEEVEQAMLAEAAEGFAARYT